MPEASQGYRVSPLRDFFRIVMMQHFGHLLKKKKCRRRGSRLAYNGRPFYLLRSASCLFWLDVDFLLSGLLVFS